MNQFEEFNKYYLKQFKEGININEEDEQIFEEKSDLNNSNEENRYIEKTSGEISSSQILNSEPKKYHIYTLVYKKKIIEEIKKIYKL